MIKKITYFLVLSILFSACKTSKVATNSSVTAMSTKNIISNHYENSFNRKTINARLKATYRDKDNMQSITIKLRLEKDKAIWMSGTMLGIPLAKIMITPHKVQFYEKIGKTYFEGDFLLLSDFLGTEVDFGAIQNLLVGQTILSLKDKKQTSIVDGESYLLEPKSQEALFDILFWLNPINFKVNKQEVRQVDAQKRLTVVYAEYQTVHGEVFPKMINITAIDKTERTFLDLEYRTVEFDKKVSFPFNIPLGYQEIVLDE